MSDILARSPQLERQKTLNRIVWVLTGVVLLIVVAMRSPYKIPLPEGVSFSFLPPVHALLNSLTALCLVAAVVEVKKGRIARHQRWMTAAFALSTTFLLCYVAYHFTTTETRYGGQGVMRLVYFFFLITHIIGAAISLPFILLTYVAAWTNDFPRHRRLARKVFPLWLYVAVTGPICYFLLMPYY
ncbi:MAG: DUF420 domain-containing protein [Verrucomicrobiales bacterium]